MKSRSYGHSVHKIISVDPLNEKAFLRMSTKTLNFLRSLDVVMPFFIFAFKFLYEIYKEFLVQCFLTSYIQLSTLQSDSGAARKNIGGGGEMTS